MGSRADGTNPRALGTNPRALAGRLPPRAPIVLEHTWRMSAWEGNDVLESIAWAFELAECDDDEDLRYDTQDRLVAYLTENTPDSRFIAPIYWQTPLEEVCIAKLFGFENPDDLIASGLAGLRTVAWCAQCNGRIDVQTRAERTKVSDRLELLPVTCNSCEKSLRTMVYSRYLATPYWQNLRQVALEQAGHRCSLCDLEESSLDVHHRSYERRGHESREDILALCRGCHSTFHRHRSLAGALA